MVRDASNALFVIVGQLGQQMTVTNHIRLTANVLSMTAVWPDVSHQLTVVALLVPIVAPGKPASDRLLRVHIDGPADTQTECTLSREYVSLAWTQSACEGSGERQQFVAVPHLSNHFDVIEVYAAPDEPSAEPSATVVLTRQTMHRVCLVRLAVGRDDTMLTWSQDGSVQLWSKADWTAVSHVRALNHYACGVREALVDPCGLHIVTLGSEANLQCVQHGQPGADMLARLAEIRQQLARAADLFASPTKGKKLQTLRGMKKKKHILFLCRLHQ